jgi:CheY-like chemotaxis protein
MFIPVWLQHPNKHSEGHCQVKIKKKLVLSSQPACAPEQNGVHSLFWFFSMLTPSFSASTESSAEKRPALVYVVDDETLIGQIVEAVLNLEGFNVRLFNNPLSAWNTFSEATEKPDVLVTDYVMRPLNGMELIQQFRSVVPEIPSILYSGNASAQITDLYAIKPSAFLPKPFLPETLVRMVRSLLENRS